MTDTKGGRLVEIVTTVATEGEAASLARELVASGLVACASFFPVRSIFRWKGEIQDEAECQVVLKTLEEEAAEVERRVRELHSYETPAVLRFPIRSANDEFVAWVQENVRGDRPRGGER